MGSACHAASNQTICEVPGRTSVARGTGTMGRFGSRIILLAVLGSLPAAENGYGGEVFLSITRKTATVTGYEEPAERVPARIDVITKEEIGRMPAHKADEVLKNITGATAIRTNGIYSVRPLVTLRGLSGEEQGRTLILKDGVPLNISDTGDVNWNSINLDEVERIEVFKGPGSSLYGSNAMGGVINIITLKPAKILEGRVSGEYGTYDTVSNKLFLAGRQYEKPAGLYWRLSGFVQNSGGYVSAPDNLRTPYSVARYLREKDGGARIGYDFNAARSIEAEYAYYTDARGEGTKILAGDGQYRDFSTANSRVRYKDRIGGTSLDVTAYSQLQKYARLSETLKGASYARFDGASDREDDGLLVQAVRRLSRANTLTGGVNARRSAIRGADCYRTSPDIVENVGALDMYAAYVQDELDTLQERLKVLAGLRYDYARFYGGYYRVRNPSSATSAWTAYNNDTFPDNTWTALTPRVSARYFLNERVSAYASYARGFRASILDDLCRSGYLWPGPKVANPSIGPENIDTYEIGGTIASIPPHGNTARRLLFAGTPVPVLCRH